MLRWLASRLKRPSEATGQTADGPPPVSAQPTSAPPTSASARDPRAAQAHYQNAQRALQKPDLQEAARHLKQAVQADESHADAQANLGAVLRDLGEREDAARHLAAALALKPRHPQAAFNLGLLRLDQRRWRDAADLLQQASQGMPGNADARYWLGNALMGVGDAEAARKAYQAALRLQPAHAQARWGLAMAQLPTIASSDKEQAAAVATFSRELGKLGAWMETRKAQDGWRAVGAQQPYYLAYIEGNHRDVLARYGAMCVSLMASRQPKLVARARAAKLRVGIVSAHIHSHSVWQAILRGWVEHLDANRFEIELFHTGHVQDGETKWAASRVRKLHQGLGEWPAWAHAIAHGGFDVLVYPEIGMDATALRLASLRLAPHQCAAWGHPLTSGLPTLDSYISAQAFEPEGAQAHYTENLVALPRLGCAYQPHATKPQAPDLSSWGIGPGDRVLVCPGVPFKYMPAYDAMLADIVRRCAPCKLVLLREQDSWMGAALEKRLRAAFAAERVDFDAAVRFIPWLSHPAFLGLLARADVVLDTAGFSGFNTAMQAMQVGAAMVAWEGQSLRSRFASGILRQMGLDSCVASTTGEFAAVVERLCKDAEERERVRQRVRAGTPSLYNDKRAVDAFADFLRSH